MGFNCYAIILCNQEIESVLYRTHLYSFLFTSFLVIVLYVFVYYLFQFFITKIKPTSNCWIFSLAFRGRLKPKVFSLCLLIYEKKFIIAVVKNFIVYIFQFFEWNKSIYGLLHCSYYTLSLKNKIFSHGN